MIFEDLILQPSHKKPKAKGEYEFNKHVGKLNPAANRFDPVFSTVVSHGPDHMSKKGC